MVSSSPASKNVEIPSLPSLKTKYQQRNGGMSQEVSMWKALSSIPSIIQKIVKNEEKEGKEGEREGMKEGRVLIIKHTTNSFWGKQDELGFFLMFSFIFFHENCLYQKVIN
jgi:hypothetical protein